MPRQPTPPVAADAIIELTDRPGRPIVLVERRFPPPGWAIPGGFVEGGIVGGELLGIGNASINSALKGFGNRLGRG